MLVDEFYLKPQGLGSDTVTAQKTEKGFLSRFSELISADMRNFNTRFRLRDSDRHIRLVYTFFLLLMLAGFTFHFLGTQHDRLIPAGIADHYRGSNAIRRTDVFP